MVSLVRPIWAHLGLHVTHDLKVVWHHCFTYFKSETNNTRGCRLNTIHHPFLIEAFLFVLLGTYTWQQVINWDCVTLQMMQTSYHPSSPLFLSCTHKIQGKVGKECSTCHFVLRYHNICTCSKIIHFVSVNLPRENSSCFRTLTRKPCIKLPWINAHNGLIHTIRTHCIYVSYCCLRLYLYKWIYFRKWDQQIHAAAMGYKNHGVLLLPEDVHLKNPQSSITIPHHNTSLRGKKTLRLCSDPVFLFTHPSPEYLHPV